MASDILCDQMQSTHSPQWTPQELNVAHAKAALLYTTLNGRHAMQDLQAQLASEQDAGARKDAELEALYQHRDELGARLADAQAPGTTGQRRTVSASGPALILPAPSDSQVWINSAR